MKSNLVSVLLFSSMLVAAPLLPAAEFSSLEERMTQSEFRAAGLDKLDAAELGALNAWIRDGLGTVPSSAAAASPEQRFGLRSDGANSRGQVVGRIDGRFTGWDGSTTFRLQNGQVWRQSEPGELVGVNLDSPAVTINSGLFGSFYLGVEGYNKRVKVERVQ